MLYAVSLYERWDNGTWEFVECVKIFREQKRAIEFAYHSIKNSSRDFYYMVGIISEETVLAGGFENLIES